MKPLTTEFFSRPTLVVAEELIGKALVREIDAGGRLVGRIVETEAYLEDDPASHAWGVRDKSTGEVQRRRRGAILFGPPGRAYIYLNYGVYWLLNVVTEPEGEAGAVLIRAVEPLEGLRFMRDHRPEGKRRDLTNGPGKLTQAFDIDDRFQLHLLTEPPLFLGEPVQDEDLPVATSSRIGISKGREHSWRFFVPGNDWVSPSKPGRPGRVRRKGEG